MKTVTINVLLDRMHDKFGDEFKVSNYINMKSHALFTHICGYSWLTSPTNFLRDGGCPKCNKRRADITTDSFKQALYELVGNEYSFNGEYTKAISKIEMVHNKCGRTFITAPHRFLDGHRCPLCWKESKLGKLKRNNEKFKQEIFDKYGLEYELIGDYKGARSKTAIKHNKCGGIYEVSPDNLLRGKRCPICNEPKGEIEIEKFLKEHNLKYKKQYQFDKCRNKNKLSFDFVVFNELYGIIACIEFDGLQHFKPIEFYGGEKAFKVYKQRDNIKNKFCKKNNIKLIRIPYWDYGNIERLLSDYLFV